MPQRVAVLLQPAERLVVASDELDLELAKSPGHSLPFHHRDRVVDDLRAVGSDDLAARSQPGDRDELAAAEIADEQRDELEGRTCGRTGLLELDPVAATLRELELPEPDPALHPVSQGDAVTGEHEVFGVVVRRSEDARGL